MLQHTSTVKLYCPALDYPEYSVNQCCSDNKLSLHHYTATVGECLPQFCLSSWSAWCLQPQLGFWQLVLPADIILRCLLCPQPASSNQEPTLLQDSQAESSLVCLQHRMVLWLREKRRGPDRPTGCRHGVPNVMGFGHVAPSEQGIGQNNKFESTEERKVMPAILGPHWREKQDKQINTH